MKRIFFLLLCAALLCGCADHDIAAEGGEQMTENREAQMIDYEETAAKLRAAIDSASAEAEVLPFGEWEPEAELLETLKKETEKLTDAGYDLGYLMIDTASGSGLSFNADQIFCSQSTIKGPYIASLYENDPESFAESKDRIRQTIRYSDNDAYAFVRQKYLSSCFKTWVEKTGVREKIGSGLYVHYSAREFAKLWTEMYRFFHTADNQELCDYYIGSRFSVTYAELGSEYTVHSKAGWEDGLYDGPTPLPAFVDKDPYNDEVATNDGALVSADNGEYIFVILSDVPSNYELLQPLVRAVDELHKGL